MTKPAEQTLEIILLGHSGVGKTTFLNGLSKRVESVKPTEGIKNEVVSLGNNRFVRIWDPSGHIQGLEINDYIRLSHFAIIMIDLSQPNRYRDVYKWLAKAELYLNCKKSILLVGTKADQALLNKCHITLDKTFNLKYIETSIDNSLSWNKLLSILKSYVV